VRTGVFQGRVNSILSAVDETLREGFERSKYPDVILPVTIARRVDRVLKNTKATVLEHVENVGDRSA
jgi:type I restriction-modification system DNA methylase subunit